MKLVRKPETRDWINIAVILILLGAFTWIGLEYTRKFGAFQTGDIISSAEKFRRYVLSKGEGGVLVLILFYILQVIVALIPGAAVQFTGGMIYGVMIGLLTAVVGTALGSAVSFYISRLLGRRVVTLFVSEKSLLKLETRLSGDMSGVLLFLLFVIPFFPKDLIAYFIGLTRMRAAKLFLISAAGRIPGMFVSVYLGAHILNRNYALLVGVTVLVCVCFLLLYIFRKNVLNLAAKKRND